MRIGVIGGGVMGLVLAYRFGKAGHQVEVFEAAPQVGGLSTWFDFGDFTWDKYYHVILRSDDALLALIDELGLTDRLHWEVTKTGFLWQGQHLSMSNNWEFLTFPALNLWEKMRLAAGILYNQQVSDPEKLHGVTSAEWLKKVFGPSVYQTVWEPLLESKFGVLKDKVPAIILWATLQRYYSTRSKGDGKERMGHLRGGCLKVLFDSLITQIQSRGGKIRCSCPIEKVVPHPDGSVTITTDTDNRFDTVVSTIPRELIPQKEDTTTLPTYLGLIRLALVTKEPLCPFYVTNLIDRHYPFTGIIDLSNLGPKEEFAGRGFVMLPRYDLPNSEWFNKSDEEIAQRFLEPLFATCPHLKGNIINTFVHRERRVQALWIDRPPPPPKPIKLSSANFYSTNNELIGYSNLNNNAVVEVANKVSKNILEETHE